MPPGMLASPTLGEVGDPGALCAHAGKDGIKDPGRVYFTAEAEWAPNYRCHVVWSSGEMPGSERLWGDSGLCLDGKPGAHLHGERREKGLV